MATFLDSHQDQCRFPTLELAASAQARLSSSNPRINFYVALQWLASQIDHGAPEFMQHHPCGFVAPKCKLPL